MQMKRILSAVVLVLFVLMSVNTPVFAQGNTEFVLPDEAYTVNGSTITGISSAYLASMNEQEKQTISLVLPDKINGTTITAIGNDAFKSSNTYKLVRVNFSNMTGLKSIGQWAFYNNGQMQGTLDFPETLETIANYAFYYCPALSGGLKLPDSVKSIGEHSFDGCTSLKGSLTLSNALTTIPTYAFYNAGFTGELTIPDGVKTIGASAFRQGNSYTGFTGALTIPDSVTTVGTVAFANQNGITDVHFSANMTAIPDSMFRYCKGLNPVLVIPEQIQSIGATAFAESSLKTVYLPKMKDQSNTAFIQGNSFNSCSSLTAIVAKEADYAAVKPLITVSSVQIKLTYEKDIQLNDAQGNKLADSLKKLYNQKYGFVKQSDGSWLYDASYKFPEVTVGGITYTGWALNTTTKSPVTAATVVGTETVLYPIEKLADPEITFSDGIDKVYDGQPATLSVAATHPKAVSMVQAKEGDVVFYYTWSWATIGSSSVALEGFDKNKFNVTDVRMPDYPISLSVSVMACNIENKNGKLTPVGFKTVKHDFSVFLKQAQPTVNPVYKAEVELKNGLPELTLSGGDTKGVITWDNGQTLEEGIHSYTWTFTPEANGVGSTNYKPTSGSVEIDAWVIPRYQMQVSAGKNGTVTPEGTTKVEQNKDFTVTIKPDTGYQVECVLVDGEDRTEAVTEGVLTLPAVQCGHTVSVTFVKIEAEDMEDILASLPEIKEGENPTRAQAESILQAKLNYELLAAQDAVSEETKQVFHELLAKLPQIQLDDAEIMTAPAQLLENVSAEDVQKLLDDPTAVLRIACTIAEREPSAKENGLLKSLDGVLLYGHYDIRILKIITFNGVEETSEISALKAPIQLEFAIPGDLPQVAEGYERALYLIRIHEENGELELQLLENESADASKLLISSDRFSLYTLGYRDIAVNDGDASLPGGNEKPGAEKPDLPNIGDNESGTSQTENKGGTSKTPSTGDSAHMAQWFVMGLAALAGGIVLQRKKKTNMAK